MGILFYFFTGKFCLKLFSNKYMGGGGGGGAVSLNQQSGGCFFSTDLSPFLPLLLDILELGKYILKLENKNHQIWMV